MPIAAMYSVLDIAALKRRIVVPAVLLLCLLRITIDILAELFESVLVAIAVN